MEIIRKYVKSGGENEKGMKRLTADWNEKTDKRLQDYCFPKPLV